MDREIWKRNSGRGDVDGSEDNEDDTFLVVASVNADVEEIELQIIMLMLSR